MTEVKTKPTSQDVNEFLSQVEPEEKRQDSIVIKELMERITGQKAVMWGSSIVGFGMYHFKSERSSQEGDWPLVGFSPRKQNLTLYLSPSSKGYQQLLKKLGKHATSVACLYINKLSDVDQTVLSKLIETSFHHSKEKYGNLAK